MIGNWQVFFLPTLFLEPAHIHEVDVDGQPTEYALCGTLRRAEDKATLRGERPPHPTQVCGVCEQRLNEEGGELLPLQQ